MALLTLATVKAHLRVFDDYDDSQIELYQAAAECIVTEYIDREVAESGEPVTEDGIVLNPAITAAILLLVGDFYENREADNESKGEAVLPRYMRALLAPWRVWRSPVEES